MTGVRPSGVSVVVSYTLFEFFSILAVILRFIGIRVRGRSVKHHDYLCVLALVTLTGYVIDTLIGTISGQIGEHITEASMHPSSLILTLKTFWASQFLWATSIASFRISILLLYIEIFAKSIVRIPAYVCIAIVSAFWFSSIVVSLTSCRPIAFQWNKTITDGYCTNLGAAEEAVAAINMVLDIVIVALPLPVIWTLQMPLNKKIGVSCTFALGLSIAAINIARIVKVVDCPLADFTYCTRDSAILTVAEMAVGVIVACVPTLGGVLFKRRLGATHQIKYADGYKNYGNSDNSHARLRDTTDSYGDRSRGYDTEMEGDVYDTENQKQGYR